MDPNNDATAGFYGPGIVTSVEQQMMTLDLSCQVIKGSGDLSRPIDTDGMKPPTSTLVKSQVAVASCLGLLGMRDILHNYIAGLCHNQNVSMDAKKQDIQEIWSEETWRLLQWDESFLTGATQQSPFLNFNRDHVRCSLQCSDHVVDRVGFHQSLSNSFFLICDDNENFSSEIMRTRMLLLSEFDEAFGHDFIDRDIVSHSIRLQSINELNSLGNVIR